MLKKKVVFFRGNVLLTVFLLLLWLLQVELEEDSEDEGFEDRPLKLEEISRPKQPMGSHRFFSPMELSDGYLKETDCKTGKTCLKFDICVVSIFTVRPCWRQGFLKDTAAQLGCLSLHAEYASM